MNFYACWFLADVEDAAAIRSITAKKRELAEWPHLILKGADGPDINKLESLTRPKKKKGEPAGKRFAAGGKLLNRGKMTDDPFTCVSQVDAEFTQRLMALDAAGVAELAGKWVEVIDRVKPSAAEELIQAMADFARQAEKAGKPVLQLDVL